MSVFNQQSDSPRDIVLGEQKLQNWYDEKLTEATLILAGMQRHDVRAFEACLRFKFIHPEMTYVERYNTLYAFCRWGLERKRNVPIEGDWYASSDEWTELSNFMKSESRK